MAGMVVSCCGLITRTDTAPCEAAPCEAIRCDTAPCEAARCEEAPREPVTTQCVFKVSEPKLRPKPPPVGDILAGIDFENYESSFNILVTAMSKRVQSGERHLKYGIDTWPECLEEFTLWASGRLTIEPAYKFLRVSW